MAEWAKQLFPVTKENVNLVRAHFNKTQNDIDKDLKIIKQWMKQQSHFPDDYDNERVERIHLRNKFRIERTKEKLEKYYTMRGENPNYFQYDLEKDVIQTVFKTLIWVPLAKMQSKLERVYLARLTGNEHLFSLEQSMMLLFILVEFEMMHDYSTGVRYICDLKDITMTHYTKLDLNVLIKSHFLFKECLSGRILGFEVINAPSFMNILLGLAKIAFPPVLFDKIRIHDNLESLKTVVDEECLPKDYGGKMKTSDELREDVKYAVLKNRDSIKRRGNMVSDESKRVGEVRKNEIFGVDGTFKKISLD